MWNYRDCNISINDYSKRAFISRRGKIIREGRTCFYDLAEDLVGNLVNLFYVSSEIPGNCDINSVELFSSNNGNFTFSFYMRNGEHHNGIDTLEKYGILFEMAKKITDTKYNSLVLFEAMKIWDKLDYFYVLDWKSTVFENGAESVKFSMMQ